jgi:5-methylcytosine-specific restriction protein B
MVLFSDIDKLYQSIKSALPSGWSFTENSSINDPVWGYIPSGKFYLWTTPSGEELVVSLRQTSLTGSDRVKPQIRVFTDNAQLAYLYAKHKNLRYFFFAYCVTPPASLKFSAGIEPSEYLVSIESKILPTTPGRLDIRSMYDNMVAPETRPFFRIPPAEHSCPSLTQSCFIRICDSSGSFTTSQLENYLQYFDSRPYMTDLSGGYRVVFNPSALYNPDPSPLDLPHNLLVHGAPGTGKSHFLNKAATDLATAGQAIYRRVTFYEEYSYGQFVGEYMPVPQEDCTETVALEYAGTPVSGTVSGEHITYRFSPGPLAELLADCYAAKLNKSPMKYILIIEELNRANAASVFGDNFQLLDREKGTSIYEITAKSEFAHYLHSAVSHKLTDDTIDLPEDAFSKIKLPDNLYIWTTLNSADQGVFPLDSAFKRRWSCIYRDVAEVDSKAAFRPHICLPVLDSSTNSYSASTFDWNTFRDSINTEILKEGFAEDRCIGYWFFSEDEMADIEKYTKATVEIRNGTGTYELSTMQNPLVDKLFAYLLQDVFRNTPASFFKENIHTLSQLRQALKNLAINGTSIDIKSLTVLPEKSYAPQSV